MNPKPQAMRFLFFVSLFFLHSTLVIGQASGANFNLTHGKYEVGFRHYTHYDNSRTYQKVMEYSTETIPRQISISVWYPAVSVPHDSEKLTVLDYFRILAEEEEWENLPNDQFLNWFYYSNTPENQQHLSSLSRAYKDLDFA